MDSPAPPTTTNFKGHQSKVQTCGWNVDGTMLASGSMDAVGLIWNFNGSAIKPQVTLRGHTDAIHALQWNPTHPNYLATASTDRSLRVWDSRTQSGAGEKVVTPGENINLSWSPDGNYIAVGNDDDVVTIVDARKLQILHQKKYQYQVNEIGWNTTGDHFFMSAFGSDATNKTSGTVEILKFEEDASLTQQYTVQCHTAACYCIAFDPTGSLFAVGSADANVSLWTLEDAVCVAVVDRHENPIRALSFNHDGTLIASGSEHHYIDVASTKTGARKHCVSTGSLTNSLHFHPKASVLAYSSDSAGYVSLCSGL
jgi:THO complex subunit 3